MASKAQRVKRHKAASPEASAQTYSQIVQDFFAEVKIRYQEGDYTEMSFRTPFENFITSINNAFRLLQEPERKQKIGAPDFKAYKKAAKVGYIETKDLGKDLDAELKSEQMTKYKQSINNLILTNYGRFIVIRNGQSLFDFELFKVSELEKGKLNISTKKVQDFLQLINTFFDYKIHTIRSAEELARELANKARLLHDLAQEQLELDMVAENGSRRSSVYDFFQGIRELIKDIDAKSSTDAYAQTITYGLFLARIHTKQKLTKDNASRYIPHSIGIIREIFANIAESLSSNVSWIIDEIIDILNASYIEKILSQIDVRGKKDRDPFSYFYEDFLRQYNPSLKKRMGVYYTPRPVVSFIVNSVSTILKHDFNKPYGFSEGDVTVLDPAVGTGTFLWLIYLSALLELKKRGLSGGIRSKIANHILRDFYGFEILITPYIIAHLKLSATLGKWHYRLADDERVQAYLTNTLEPSESYTPMPFMRELNQESKTAGEVKRKKQILVVVSNPPYAVSSSNKSEWITKLMRDYKKDLDEKNIKHLDDDYLKFIRFAQYKIEQNGQGIIGFITNNSYLDGITHRQIRLELMKVFDKIIVLNLHGDTRKGERSPDGSEDENVFDIQQGVAISLFVKTPRPENQTKVYYADVYGKRSEKYHWLDSRTIDMVEWQELHPTKPYYFFKPWQGTTSYEDYISLKSIFRSYSSGVATGLDRVFIDFNRKQLIARIRYILSSNDLSKYQTELDSSAGRKILKHREPLLFDEEHIKLYHYRPFDFRYIYYQPEMMERGRADIATHLLHNNLSLVVSRTNAKRDFDSVLVTKHLCDLKLAESTRGSFIFPLYISSKESNTLEKNFTKDFTEFLRETYLGNDVKPEDVLGYIYAILFSDKYRKQYAEQLKIDFPRIPFVSNYSVFQALSSIGKELINMHTITGKLSSTVKFDVEGSNTIKYVKYKGNRVYINRDQFFESISENIWNFQMGGYQVLDKWLKSRKNRQLNDNEIEQFIQIVAIIHRTLELIDEIDRTNFLV